MTRSPLSTCSWASSATAVAVPPKCWSGFSLQPLDKSLYYTTIKPTAMSLAAGKQPAELSRKGCGIPPEVIEVLRY